MNPHSSNVDGHPGEQRRNARGAAAQQVELAQNHGGGAREATSGFPHSNDKGSRATVMNRSSSVSLPCSRGRLRGSPSSRIWPCDRNSTRSHTSSTSYMLWEVHSTPRVAGAREIANAGADVRRWRDRATRSARPAAAAADDSASPWPGRRASARPRRARRPWCRGIVPDRTAPAAPRCARVRCLHAVDHAEDAQVLLDGQVSRQRRVDGGEVGARKRLRSGAPRDRCLRSGCCPRSARARRGSC